MIVQEFRNAQGHLIGQIRNAGSNLLEMTDKNARIVGTYNIRENKTYARSGQYIGQGNLLATLLSW